MKDRLIGSALAGLIGGIIQDIYGITMKSLKLTDRIFIDYAESVIMFKPHKGTLAFIIGLTAHLILCIGLGVLFGYIIRKSSSNYYLLKGLGFGILVWFVLMGSGTALNLPEFKTVPPQPALVALIGSSIYGVVTAFTLKFIDKKTNLL